MAAYADFRIKRVAASELLLSLNCLGVRQEFLKPRRARFNEAAGAR